VLALQRRPEFGRPHAGNIPNQLRRALAQIRIVAQEFSVLTSPANRPDAKPAPAGGLTPALPYEELKPGQVKTGRRGYLGKFGSVADRRQRMNWLPRSLRIFWACVQSAHRPACLRSASSATGIAAAYGSVPRRILAARATPDSPLASASPFAPASASSFGAESPSPGARKRLLSRPCCLV
jgi:hypothetical protein